MKRKPPTNDHCDRIFNSLSPPEKQALLSQLSNYDQLCESNAEKDPLLFKDVVTLLSSYLDYNDYTALKLSCGTFYRRLGYYPPFARLRRFYDNCLTEETPLFLMIRCFKQGVFDYVKRMYLETGTRLTVDLVIFSDIPLTKKYFKIGPAMVHYPTGLLLKSSDGNISRTNPRGQIYQEVPSDTFHTTTAKQVAYMDGHMSEEQKLAIKRYDSFLTKNKRTF